MTTEIQTKPNRFLQANLASVLGLIPTYLISTNLPDQMTQAFEHWRQGLQLSIRYDALLGMSIYWWIPALLVFLLMRFTNFEQWLKVNLLAHISIMIANISLLILVSIVVYHNDHVYLYGLSSLRDSILTTTLSFAAILCVSNILWHYVVLPNSKLRAWLTDDVFAKVLK
ncbi:MAG TPA: hypothetical protein PL131_11295 [Methylotenera sp.]|nr:hypothetical protein [Methylotenera sp.]HPH06452.1 hypothetical protein [Methylotenera sp.]HPN00401.1 hypothetical protein [Methylotenera sp.]